ncbi:unnamed protein product [Timema podura]|uniref:COG complex component COG2 C-terminal domain-containing protein n=1 Tax=Timema podura TaxID=61482 RepID=A0ABN7PJI4_TIMPD|nr:unnamed protein product [Timema podura]
MHVKEFGGNDSFSLKGRFWKLSLQIIARYCTWIEEAWEEKWPSESSPSTNGTNLPPSEGTQSDRLLFLVYLHADIESFADKLKHFPAMTSTRLDGVSPQTCEKLYRKKFKIDDSIEESKQQLLSRLPIVTQFILGEVSSQSLSQLRQVNDIPRLFRRTNRDIPTKPCLYVAAVLAPPLSFHKAYREVVGAAQLQRWLTLIFSAITQQ